MCSPRKRAQQAGRAQQPGRCRCASAWPTPARPAAAPVLPLLRLHAVQGVDGLHLLVGQVKVEELQVLHHAVLLGGARDDALRDRGGEA